MRVQVRQRREASAASYVTSPIYGGVLSHGFTNLTHSGLGWLSVGFVFLSCSVLTFHFTFWEIALSWPLAWRCKAKGNNIVGFTCVQKQRSSLQCVLKAMFRWFFIDLMTRDPNPKVPKSLTTACWPMKSIQNHRNTAFNTHCNEQLGLSLH